MFQEYFVVPPLQHNVFPKFIRVYLLGERPKWQRIEMIKKLILKNSIYLTTIYYATAV